MSVDHDAALDANATKGMWATSQSAGNRVSSPDDAMTAPGSQPVDPEISAEHQSDPTVDLGQQTAGGRHLDRGDSPGGPGSPSWTGTAAGTWGR